MICLYAQRDVWFVLKRKRRTCVRIQTEINVFIVGLFCPFRLTASRGHRRRTCLSVRRAWTLPAVGSEHAASTHQACYKVSLCCKQNTLIPRVTDSFAVIEQTRQDGLQTFTLFSLEYWPFNGTLGRYQSLSLNKLIAVVNVYTPNQTTTHSVASVGRFYPKLIALYAPAMLYACWLVSSSVPDWLYLFIAFTNYATCTNYATMGLHIYWFVYHFCGYSPHAVNMSQWICAF